MKNILILSYYFPPSGGGGVQRISKFLKYLDKNKYNIHVIAASNFGIAVADKKLEEEIPKYVKVHRIENIIPHDKISKIIASPKQSYETSTLKRWVSSFIFIPDSRRQWIKGIKSYMIKYYDQFKHIDLIIASMPPFSTGLAACEINKKYGIPIVLDYRDGWYYNHFQCYPTVFHKMINKYLEKKVLSRTTGIVFVTNELKKKYLSHFNGVDWNKKQVTAIYNGFDEDDFTALSKLQNKPENIIKIGLPGTIYFKVSRPLTLLNFLKKIKFYPEKKYEFYIFGKWTKSFENKIKRYKISKFFKFHSYLSHDEYLKKINEMDYNFLFLEKDVKNIECGIPGRFYELLKADVPLVVWGPEKHEIQDIIDEIGGKNLYRVNDEKNIQEFLSDIKGSLPYKNENMLKLNEFSRKFQAEQLSHFIGKVME